jgi:phage terminase large subunit-like protein
MGPHIVAWMQTNLRHAEGNVHGQPFRLHPWGADLVNRWYELNRDGTRKYDRGLVGVAKGNAKTEYSAAIACAEFCGPVVFTGWDTDGAPQPGILRSSPDVPVVANSFEQAGLLFNAARAMLKGGPLADHLEFYETEILLKDAPGKLWRVPAVAANVDGCRPSFVAFDEIHEFAGARERVFVTLEAGRAKRGASGLSVTTAGWDLTSLLGKLYAHAKRIEAGEVADPGFLFIWYEAAEHWDLSKPDQLEAAIREANPAVGSFLMLDHIIRQWGRIPDADFLRYHLNRWSAAPTQWMPAELFASAAHPRHVPEGTAVVLAIDGSYNQDSTALLGCTLEAPHYLFVLDLWERPTQAPSDWRVPRADVLDAIAQACAHYTVERLAVDDAFGRIWSLDFEALRDKGVNVVEWPTRSHARMGPAAAAFYGAIADGRLTHDGDPRLAAHIAHCVAKGTRYGPVPTKDAQDSSRKIDAGVTGIVAYETAMSLSDGGGEFAWAAWDLPQLGSPSSGADDLT